MDNQNLKMSLHPYFFAIFPTVFLYSHNIHELITLQNYWRDLAVLIGGFCLANYILIAAANRVFKNPPKVAVLISLAWVLVFLPMDIEQATGWRPRLIAYGLATLFFIVTILVVRSKRSLKNLNSTLTTVSALLVISNFSNIVFRFIKFEIHGSNVGQGHEVTASQSPSDKPDVYYIILDQYPSAKTLKTVFGYDNSPFVDELKQLGFKFPANPNANYPFTRHSIPSSLSADYLDRYAAELGAASLDLNLPIQSMFKSRVATTFQNLGYRFVTFNAAIDIPPLQSNPNADVLIDCGVVNPLHRLLLRKTVFNHIFHHDLNRRRNDNRRKSLQCIASSLGRLPEMEGPKFVLAYFLCPHPPWLYGRNGEEIDLPPGRSHYELSPEENRKYFIAQLEYWNGRMLEEIRRIVKDSTSRPIIVLQSDHGTAWGDGWKDPESKDKPTDEGLSELMGILSAYFVPPSVEKKLYDTITPVNSFRLLWKEYYGENVELLPDRIYYSNYPKSPYLWTDVSERLGVGNPSSQHSTYFLRKNDKILRN